MKTGSLLKNYSSLLLLIAGIVLGSVAGIVFEKKVEIIKPVGDVFLNLLFCAVVPLVFFAIASAISGVKSGTRISGLMKITSLVFLSTVLISAVFTLVANYFFPIGGESTSMLGASAELEKPASTGDLLTNMFTTGEFYLLLSRKNMLAMIIFSVIIGFSIRREPAKSAPFKAFIDSGYEVMKNVITLIMKLGPLGLGAYFAYQVGVFGPQLLLGTYAKSMALYYGTGTIYFIVFFSLYAMVARGRKGLAAFWKNNIVPSFTALGTCSSIATLPANLEAADAMGIRKEVSGLVVPLGATLHKDGSSISSIVKILVVFGIFGRSLDTPAAIAIALGMTVLVSIVEGGVPNGGYIGEILFISAYGLPPEALAPAMIIGTLVDPLATLLNATGDTVSAMVIERFYKEPA